MHKATRKLSEKVAQLNHDVGGCCGSANAMEDDTPDAAGTNAIGDNPGIELLQRIQGADAPAIYSGDGRGDGVSADGVAVPSIEVCPPPLSPRMSRRGTTTTTMTRLRDVDHSR